MVAVNRDWLFSKIITTIPKVIIAGYVINLIIKLVFNLPNGPLEKNDFLDFWVASSLTLGGEPAAVYEATQFHAALAKVAGHEYPAPWFYPPTCLLLISPLALLPYYASLASWLSLTLGGYLLVVRRIAPHPTAVWLALAFPGALMNLNYGQNGLFSSALFGGGLLLLNSFPVLAGIVLGMLSYKPNFFVLIPVALLAGRYWRALGSTILSAILLALASGLILGWNTWEAFWHIRHIPIQAMEHGLAALQAMPTIFAVTRSAGGSPLAAYALQGIVMAASVSVVVWVWFRKSPMAIRVSVLTLGSLLFTPFGYEYEFARLAIPLAWIGWEGYQKGWLPREKIFLLMGWLTPFISRILADAKVVQLTPFILMGLLYLNLRSPRLSPLGAAPVDSPAE
jgi:hypothetical protein